jgi:hypothetical protein
MSANRTDIERIQDLVKQIISLKKSVSETDKEVKDLNSVEFQNIEKL